MFKKLVLFIFLLMWGFPLFFSHAFEIPHVGDDKDWVRDYAGVLSIGEEQILEDKVHAIEDITNSQIALVIIKSLEGEDIDELGAKWAEERGIGYKEVDNGIFVLVAVDDHKWRIDVGYGLEGAVPDITAWHIGNEKMTPYFKHGDYFGGLDNVLDALSQAIAGEYDIEDISTGGGDTRIIEIFLIGLFVLSVFSLFLVPIVRAIIGIPDQKGGKVNEKILLQNILMKKNKHVVLPSKDKKRLLTAGWGSFTLTILGSLIVGLRGMLYIVPLYFIRKWLMFTEWKVSGGGSSGSSYSSSGSFGGGGASGGGSSGFGGGSFGGGGASGGW